LDVSALGDFIHKGQWVCFVTTEILKVMSWTHSLNNVRHLHLPVQRERQLLKRCSLSEETIPMVCYQIPVCISLPFPAFHTGHTQFIIFDSLSLIMCSKYKLWCSCCMLFLANSPVPEF
jgi:hypothetical protein